MKPINRIQEFLEVKDIAVSAFERTIGASNGSIQQAIVRNASLKDKTLNDIIDAFPEISPMWLLRGDGDMFLNEEDGEEEVGALPSPRNQSMEEVLVAYLFKKLRPHLKEQKNIMINLNKLFLIMDELRDDMDDVKAHTHETNKILGRR